MLDLPEIKTEKKSNCITTHLRLKGALASRLNNKGILDKRLRRYHPGTSRMSIEQEKIRQEQEASGRLYYLARNFTDFKNWFDNI
ncbi:MAG TPA: hypothetical protein VMV77_05725 [Bacteroidales bacterium]|nr:hypothetical protein [Bacteroidales bacterium]